MSESHTCSDSWLFLSFLRCSRYKKVTYVDSYVIAVRDSAFKASETSIKILRSGFYHRHHNFARYISLLPKERATANHLLFDIKSFFTVSLLADSLLNKCVWSGISLRECKLPMKLFVEPGTGLVVGLVVLCSGKSTFGLSRSRFNLKTTPSGFSD